MKIVFENKEVINSKEIYIHDSYFKQINYDDENKILYVICQDYFHKKIKTICFYNVIYFEMQNGYFWSSHSNSESIIDWDLSENNQGLKRLEQLKNENGESYINIDNKKYIESFFLSSEGNKFTIVCEEIEYNERDTIN